MSVRGGLGERHYIAASGSKTKRQFCQSCHTVMFDRSEGFEQLLGVMVSQIQPPFSFAPSCHVFVRDKKPKVEIPAGMKVFEMGVR